MNPRRGAVGVIIAIAVALFVLIGGGSYLVMQHKNIGQKALTSETQPSSEAEVGVQPPSKFAGVVMQIPPPRRNLSRVDVRVSKDQDGVYLEKQPNTFIKLSAADPASLVRIYAAVAGEKLAPGALAPAPSTASGDKPVFYKDSQNVYILEDDPSSSDAGDTSLFPVEDVDLATFHVLSDQYAADADHVYVITTTCQEGVCTQSLVVIPEADLPSFVAFQESLVPQADGSGTVVVDAADIHNVYYGGEVVGASSQSPDEYKKLYGTPDQNGLILLAP